MKSPWSRMKEHGIEWRVSALLRHLHYGMEIQARKTESDEWHIVWFERIGDRGFYTTEQGLVRFVGSLAPNMAGYPPKTIIDFEVIRPHLTGDESGAALDGSGEAP